MAAAPIDLGNEADAGLDGFDVGEQQEQQVADSNPDQHSTDGVQQTEQPVDGRRGPANIRNSIKAVAEWAQNNSEALPDHAAGIKALGDAYFREQAFKQHFPTLQEAATAKQLIEGIGGVEGATQLQARIQSYDLQDAGLKEGNPEVLDAMFKDFPEGAAALAPHYLDRLAKSNPEAFSNAIAPHAIAMLDNAGIGQHLQAMLNETDPERAKALTQQLAKWFEQQSQNAKIPAPTKAPGQDKVAQAQEENRLEREKIFMERVSDKVNSSTTPELKKYVDQYAKSYKLNDKQKARFEASLGRRVVEEMKADQTYMQQVELRKQNKARTHDTVASYIASEFNRRIKDAAFAEAQEVYGAPKGGSVTPSTGVPRADGPKTAPNGGPMKVTQRPQDSEFASYPELEMDIIQGRARLKNGRFVAWR